MTNTLTLVRRELSACRPLRSLDHAQPSDDLWDDLHLDSLDVTTVALALEEQLHIDLPDRLVGRWRTVGDVVACVDALRVKENDDG